MVKTDSKPHCHQCAVRFGGVLCALKEEPLLELDHHKTVNRYKKGQIIFYEGNEPFGLYCINAGRVKLYKSGEEGRNQIVRIAGPGDLLGYRSLFAEEPYQATAEVMEEAEICCIDRNVFFPILAKNPELSLNIIKKLSQELKVAEDLATSIAQKNVRERMAELILMLKESYGKPSSKGTLIDLQLTREEMAEMIGATLETAIRLISEFRKEKIIEIENRKIRILNVKMLVDLAGLDLYS